MNKYTGHSLVKTASEDRRERLAAAALNQNFVAGAPVSIVLAADYSRTTARYGERGLRYIHMEVGHSTQNIYLQCGSLGLGAVAVGAFADKNVKALLEIEEEPLMIIPVGDISSR
jgi:SagB-type dehydrogenase family enzyme